MFNIDPNTKASQVRLRSNVAQMHKWSQRKDLCIIQCYLI